MEVAAGRRAPSYVAVAAIGHFAWETAQIPLYTIWSNGTAVEIAVAILHCTAGDVLITVGTLVIAGLIGRGLRWPRFGVRMLLAAIVLGIAYTVFSEWLNVEVWRSWSYTAAMPVLPWLGTGLSPVLQWLVVPGVAMTLTFGWETILIGLNGRR